MFESETESENESESSSSTPRHTPEPDENMASDEQQEQQGKSFEVTLQNVMVGVNRLVCLGLFNGLCYNPFSSIKENWSLKPTFYRMNI